MRNQVASLMVALTSFTVSAAAQPGTATNPEQHLAQMERVCRERHSLAQVPPKFERRCQNLELNRDAETLIAQTPEQRVEIYLTLNQGVQREALATLGEQYEIEPLMVHFTDYAHGEYQGGGAFNLGMFRGSWQEKFKLSDDEQRSRTTSRLSGASVLSRPRSTEGVERLLTGGTGYTTMRQFARLRSDPQIKSVSLSLKVSDQEYQLYRQSQRDHAGPPTGTSTGTAFGASSPSLQLNKKP